MVRRFDRYSIYVALLIAWVAMCGSLYFSEVAGYLPCRYCWFQRILMYPLSLILAVAVLRRDRGVVAYALPFSVLGIGLATYHYLIQKTTLFGVSSCQEGIPCSTIWINWFGFATIPFLSLTAFLAITVLLLAGMQSEETVLDDVGRTPWIPVGTLVALVVVIFWGLAIANRPDAESVQPTVAINLTPIVAGENMALDGARLFAETCARVPR